MSRSQRELPIAKLRKETFLNLRMLSNARPMQQELTRFLYKENCLDKPTQNLFNHLSYYLVSIIDSQAASKLPWPLFDSKAERAFRNELNIFVCSNKSLTPVISSYFVNPGCYKVTVLVLQMSSLAIRTVVAQMGNESQKLTLKNIDEAKLKGYSKDTLMNFVEKTQMFQNKLSNHFIKIQNAEKTASKLCSKIVEYEKQLQETRKYLNSLVDNYIESNQPDDMTKKKFLSMKNVKEECSFFDDWLVYVDSQVIEMEEQFNKTLPFIDLCHKTSKLTKEIVMRYTCQMDRNEYTISFNNTTDKICTQNLEHQVNVEQAYILKNIVMHGKLNFPNLIRAFTIAILHILKNNQVDDRIYDFNKYLDIGKLKYNEISNGLQTVMGRISHMEDKLELSSPISQCSNYANSNIYPGSLSGPSLTNLKAWRDFKGFFETFSPLITSKYKFNFYRNANNSKQPLLLNLQPPKENIMKSFILYNKSSNSNMSSNSNVSNIKSNETIADCASGFTKQQLQRLFTTKKTSSSKKFKYSNERPANIKSTALNFDSGVSIDRFELTRCHSSPNLFENREKRSIPRDRRRKLSIMKEDSSLELSGISVLQGNSNMLTPRIDNAERAIKIVVTNTDLNNLSKETISSECQSIESTVTPKTNTNLIKKTSSIEKIINRFKKVRASIVPTKQSFTLQEETCFAEENVGRSIMPDLLSPSLSFTEENQISFGSDGRRPRESLGTALGVDQTFLDQFDLID